MAHILVIDDNDALRVTMQQLLQEAGFQVSAAPNGARGIAVLHAIATDLVITDIFMPDCDGLEMIARVRREFPGLPIVAISGGGSFPSAVDYLDVARKLGAVDVLQKPIDAITLFKVVDRILAGPTVPSVV